MKYALLLSAIVEFIGSYLMYFQAHLIFSNPNIINARYYGLAALVISIICFYAFKTYREEKIYRTIFLVIMFFQGAIALITCQDKSEQLIYRNESIITHVVIFAIFVIAYLREIKPEK